MLISVRRSCVYGLLLLSTLAAGSRPAQGDPLNATTPTFYSIFNGEIDLSVFDNSRNPGRITAISMGDLNGDGRADLLLGAPYSFGYNLSGPAPGNAYVIYGGFPTDFFPTVDLTGMDANPSYSSLAIPGGTPPGISGFQIGGEFSSMRFGSAVATGDFDGDGVDDFAVSAPRRLTDQAPGRVYIIKGDPAYQYIVGLAALRIFQRAITVLGPDRPEDPSFGETLAFLDHDNDGRDDLAIGSPNAGPGGEVLIIYGDDFTSQSVDGGRPGDSGMFSTIYEAEAPGDQFGAGLAVGDVSGDGRADLIVGAPLHDAGGTDSGRVYALFGADRDIPNSFPLLARVSLAATSASLTIDGPLAKEAIGYSAAVGDFDSNGLNDLAIGAPRSNASGLSAIGKVYVLYNDGGFSSATAPVIPDPTTTGTALFQSTISGSRFGTSLVAGPFSLDARDDLMIGAPELAATPGRAVRGGVFGILGRDGAERPHGVFPIGSSPNTVVADFVVWSGDMDSHLGQDLALGAFDAAPGLDLVMVGNVVAEGPFGSAWMLLGRDPMPIIPPVFESVRPRWPLYR